MGSFEYEHNRHLVGEIFLRGHSFRNVASDIRDTAAPESSSISTDFLSTVMRNINGCVSSRDPMRCRGSSSSVKSSSSSYLSDIAMWSTFPLCCIPLLLTSASGFQMSLLTTLMANRIPEATLWCNMPSFSTPMTCECFACWINLMHILTLGARSRRFRLLLGVLQCLQCTF